RTKRSTRSSSRMPSAARRATSAASFSGLTGNIAGAPGHYTNVTSRAAAACRKGVAKNRERAVCRRPMSTRVPAFLFLATLALAASAHASLQVPGFEVTTFQGGLSAPTAIAFLPDGRMLITEKGGALKLSDGTSASTLITLGVCSDSEMGLLGVAVDPNFSSNGFIYLYRTDNSAGCGSATGRFNQVVRVTMGPGDTVSPGSLNV